MWFQGEVAGRFACEALRSGEGDVCAVFRRSFYLRTDTGRYACVGEHSLGNGPLNVRVTGFSLPRIGERVTVSLAAADTWRPRIHLGLSDLEALKALARSRLPREGLGCLIVGAHNALSGHAQPALDALGRWLVGNALANEAEALIGLGPGLTPSGDDYLAGMLVALRVSGRGMQAEGLWRWLQPRLEARTSALSAAHLTAAAAGEAHEALHAVLGGEPDLEALGAVGHTSGWDALAGALAVLDPLN